MRKVKILERKQVQIDLPPDEKGRVFKKCKVEKQEVGEGLFHQWGMEYEEYENGIGNYSVAIVELKDGSVETIQTNLIRFIDNNEVSN
jgi:hypothetical protein